MLKLLTRILLLILIICVATGTFAVFMRNKVSTYLQASIDKHHTLSSRNGRKIVLVGGSNTAFGFDSELLEKELGREVVNMGLHADLGLRFMMKEVKSSVYSGDIVVLSLEYEHYHGDLSPNYRVLTQLLLASPKAVRYISFPDDYFGVLSNLYVPFNSFYWFYFHKTKEEERIYARRNFNTRGDVEIPEYMERSTYTPSVKRKILPISKINPVAIKEIKQFIREINRSGAQVLVVLPPIAEPIYENNKNTVQDFFRYLQHNLEAPLIGEPYESVFVTQDFFDTGYHLTSIGKRKRTERILKSLKRKIDG